MFHNTGVRLTTEQMNLWKALSKKMGVSRNRLLILLLESAQIEPPRISFDDKNSKPVTDLVSQAGMVNGFATTNN